MTARVAVATSSASRSKDQRVMVPPGPLPVDDGLGLAEAGGGVLDQAGERPPLQVPPGIRHI